MKRSKFNWEQFLLNEKIDYVKAVCKSIWDRVNVEKDHFDGHYVAIGFWKAIFLIVKSYALLWSLQIFKVFTKLTWRFRRKPIILFKDDRMERYINPKTAEKMERIAQEIKNELSKMPHAVLQKTFAKKS